MTLRKVVGHEWCGACRYTGYEDKSIRLKLDCGHDQAARKASDFSRGIPKRAHCRHCERFGLDMQRRSELKVRL